MKEFILLTDGRPSELEKIQLESLKLYLLFPLWRGR